MESGQTGLENSKTFASELKCLKHLAGDYVSVGLWACSDPRTPHRSIIYKQLSSDGRVSLPCFRTKSGWVFSDTLEISINSDGAEVAADMFCAWSYTSYMSKNGKTLLADCTEYQQRIH